MKLTRRSLLGLFGVAPVAAALPVEAAPVTYTTPVVPVDVPLQVAKLPTLFTPMLCTVMVAISAMSWPEGTKRWPTGTYTDEETESGDQT